MSVRRTSLCLFCQARQSSIGRRKAITTARRRLETISTKRDDDVLLLHEQRPAAGARTGDASADTTGAQDEQSGQSAAEAEALRQGLLEFELFNQQRAMRLEALKNMRNPWPKWYVKDKPLDGQSIAKEPTPPEAAAAPIPHATFRRNLKKAEGYKAIRQILRAQLLRCEYPKDVFKIMAVVMNNPLVAKDLAALNEPIIRAMYRCRNNVSDPEVLRTIRMIARRFDMAGLEYGRHLLYVGLKFAARSRSLPGMKWFLRRIRESNRGMSSNIFRSVVAKFSIGHRGLGEIRNGRWRREHLMQVLTGFDDCTHLPPKQQYHLGSFMVRDDWQYLHGWVAVLARCREADAVWREWELWKSCAARCKPRGLNGQDKVMTTKLRGDYWFVEQMTYTKDLRRAWKLVEETGLRFSTLKLRVKSSLLEGIEHMPRALWNEEVRQALIWKYDLDLSKIEQALGVTWSSEESSHTLIPQQTQEEALERLAAHDFGAEDHYGFPYSDEVDEGAIVEVRERALHDAKEEDQGLRSNAHMRP